VLSSLPDALVVELVNHLLNRFMQTNILNISVDVNVLQKFSCHVKSKGPKDDISSIKYVHSYSVFLSKMLLSWLSDLLRIGYRRYLCLEDLGQIVQV